ncbi:MAG: MATE family efflux transporter [Bacteroidota bacterium]|nr:MATE family efflux transporter [Bacteroidota bacterium]
MTENTSSGAPLDTGIRNLLRIAVPISLGSLVQFLVVLTDNFFLSRAGELEINGAGNAGLIYLTFTMIIAGGSVGIQILVARFKGQNDPAQMAHAFRAGRLGLGALGLLLATVVLGINVLGGWKLLLQNPDVQAVFEPFLGVRAWGLIPFAVLMAVEADWIGQAKTRPILALALLMASTNVVLDAMWVEGWWGGIAMGAQGAAYASFTAECVGALFAWLWASRKTHPAAYMGSMQRNRAMERQWWSLSAPVMAQFGMTIATWASFFFFVERVGMMELKVSHLTRNAFMLAFVICSGLGQTTRTVVSTLIGEGRSQELVPAILKLAALSYGGLWLLTHGYLFYPDWLASHFFEPSPGLDAMIATLGTAFVALQFYALSSILIAVLQGAGFTKPVFLIEFISVGIYVVVAYAVTLVWTQPIDVIWRADWIYFICMILGAAGALRALPWRQGHPSLKEAESA